MSREIVISAGSCPAVFGAIPDSLKFQYVSGELGPASKGHVFLEVPLANKGEVV